MCCNDKASACCFLLSHCHSSKTNLRNSPYNCIVRKNRMPSLHHFIFVFFLIFKIFDVFFLGHFEIPSCHSPDMSLVAHAKNAYSGSHYTGPYGRSLSLLLPCAQTPPFKSFSDLVSNWNVFVKSVRFQRKEGGGSLPLHQQLGLLCYDRRSQ